MLAALLLLFGPGPAATSEAQVEIDLLRLPAWSTVFGGGQRTKTRALLIQGPGTHETQVVEISDAASLEVVYGMRLDAVRSGNTGVRFTVLFREADRPDPTRVWHQLVAPTNGDFSGFQRETLDLAPLQGKRGSFVLTTGDATGRGAGLGAYAEATLIQGSQRVALLADARKNRRGPGTTESTVRERHIRLTLPEHAILELEGEVRLAPGKSETSRSVTLRARMNQKQLFRRRISPQEAPTRFRATVPLATFARRKVSISLSVDPSPATLSDIVAVWTRATIRQSAKPSAVPEDGKNILFVVVDTLRRDHLGLYGYKRPTSPRLEVLAKDSLVYDQAIAPSSWTMLSTASFLTGLQAFEHGTESHAPLDDSHLTLADHATRHGMATLGVSANPIVGRREGFAQGFQRFEEIPWKDAGAVNQKFRTWLRQHKKHRWLAYLHYMDPHDPYAAPKGFRYEFVEDLTSPFLKQGPWRNLVNFINFGQDPVEYSPKDLETIRALYDTEILYWDTKFGELIQDLKKQGLLENTLVVVTSDHGEEFLEHGLLKHGFHLYGESTGVPLLIYAPGLVKPGRVAGPAEARRITPTLLYLLGFSEDREALLPGIEPSSGSGSVYSFTNHGLSAAKTRTDFEHIISVQDERWKYIQRIEGREEELYDLLNDPAETKNLAKEKPTLVEKYREMVRSRIPDRLKPATTDPDVMEKLKELGYVK